MEGTVSIAGATPSARAMASSGQLRKGESCCRFYLITLIPGLQRTFNPKAGRGTCTVQGCNVKLPWRCEFDSESFMGSGQKLTMKLAGDECPASNSIETHTFFGLYAFRKPYLSSFATRQSLLRDAKGILATTWKLYALIMLHLCNSAKF